MSATDRRRCADLDSGRDLRGSTLNYIASDKDFTPQNRAPQHPLASRERHGGYSQQLCLRRDFGRAACFSSSRTMRDQPSARRDFKASRHLHLHP
jgi:hypothetical protein